MRRPERDNLSGIIKVDENWWVNRVEVGKEIEALTENPRLLLNKKFTNLRDTGEFE